MASIVFEHVTKRYADGMEAVTDMNLAIADGEFMVLVGPSGSGKSTALRTVAGLEDVTEGIIRIGDDIVNDLAPRDRDIAMVFQNYALYPHMTVRKNMGFALKLAGAPRKEIARKVEEAARVLDIEPQLDRKPANLSGGQRQRVAMGRAIVRDPKAFVMDEPLSNLDAKLRAQTRTALSRLRGRPDVAARCRASSDRRVDHRPGNLVVARRRCAPASTGHLARPRLVRAGRLGGAGLLATLATRFEPRVPEARAMTSPQAA